MPTDFGKEILQAVAGIAIPMWLMVRQRRKHRQGAEATAANPPLALSEATKSRPRFSFPIADTQTTNAWPNMGAALVIASGLVIAAIIDGRWLAVRDNVRSPGWYLMSPPIGQLNGPPIPDLTASRSGWQVEHAFGTASECEEFRGKYTNSYRAAENACEAREKGEAMSMTCASLEQEVYVECIATDDPQLKRRQ